MYRLNLLPPSIKRAAELADIFRRWEQALTALLICTLIGGGLLFSSWIMLSRHATSVQQQLEQAHADQRKHSSTDITTTTQQLNTTIKSLSSALGTPLNWSKSAMTVLQIIPKGASIKEFTLDPTNSFRIVGVADTRQTFTNLDTALTSSTALKNVLTKSKASKRADLPFDYSGVIVGGGQ